MKRILIQISLSFAGALFAAQTAIAVPAIAYEWTEGGPGSGTNSLFNSFHNATGPVLADDFTAAVGGQVVQVDWWGSAGVSGSSTWEITFHNDAAGVPSFPVVSQHFVSSSGVDPDGDGVFFFSAIWSPQDILLNMASDYWFSVAKASTSSWLWANAGGAGPTVGSEQYDALQSVGGSPSTVAGPHDGPWLVTTSGQDFGFRIWVDAAVPEPTTLLLLGLGLAGLGVARKRLH